MLSGGELAAAVLMDSVGRLLPGVLNDENLPHCLIFFRMGSLVPPVYTRPAEFRGWKVPDVLLSGNPKLVEEWRFQKIP